MIFYNRTAEREKLARALRRERRQFIVLYGRRRCGKSTLLREILRETDIYYLAVQSDPSLQLEQLSALLEAKFPGFAGAKFTDWHSLLTALNGQVRERFTLIIDEFPYLVKSASDLPSILQRLIDDRQRLNFDIILCGSSQQMMRGIVLSATAPLFGRADEIMKIDPLRAGWLLDHLPGSGAEELITEFATWGGAPRYWELRKDYPDYTEAVKELVLSPQGVLRGELTRLLLDDMREPTLSVSLLSLIANGVHKISELGGRLGKPATDLSRPLARLLELGYVKREMPYGSKPRGRKGNLYKVSDPFMRFYFWGVYPNISRLGSGNVALVWEQLSASLPLFVSTQWENMVREALSLHPDFTTTLYPPSRWWGKGSEGEAMEIDIVALSVDGGSLMVGECKWARIKAPDKLQAELLKKAKRLPFYDDQEIIPVLIGQSFAHTPKCMHLMAEDILALLRC